jgi:hypothetical protein
VLSDDVRRRFVVDVLADSAAQSGFARQTILNRTRTGDRVTPASPKANAADSRPASPQNTA